MEIVEKVLSQIEDFDLQQWNALAVDSVPMLEYEYLHALEKSGAVCAAGGYKPAHLGLYHNSSLVALAPLYLRDRAFVEFGDGGMLEFLSEITGLPFGSGLVGSIPFTPVPGYDFLLAPGLDRIAIFESILKKIDAISMERALSTSRFYFVSPTSSLNRILTQHGYIRLSTPHLVWANRGYRTFEDFLLSFKSARRTKIRREYRSIRDQGIELSMLEGLNASPSVYNDLYLVYRRTWAKYMGSGIKPFLNEAFFRLLGENFGRRCTFCVAKTAEEKVGMALFFTKAQRLYGRYWGAFREVPFLHFATCYYHPISFAIENGLQTFDPGFGGEHKTIRGFEESSAVHYIKFYDDNQRRLAFAVLEQIRNRQSSK